MFNLSKTNEPHRTDERLVVPERWRDQRLALNVAGNGARLFAQYTERLGLPKAEVEQFLLAEQHAPRHAYLVNLTAQSLREMEQRSAQNNIEFFNLFPVFREYQGAEHLYFDSDMHWTPKGHLLMAQALFPKLRSLIVSSVP